MLSGPPDPYNSFKTGGRVEHSPSFVKEGLSYGRKSEKERFYQLRKWGYIFIAPFFLIFAVFQLIPMASTIYYSFLNITAVV